MESDPRLGELELRIMRLEAQLNRLSIHQSQVDERVGTIERSWLYSLWAAVYGRFVRLWSLFRPQTSFGGRHDLRIAGDYIRFLNHQQHQMEQECKRDNYVIWDSQPLLSIVLTGEHESADAVNTSLESVRAQYYPNWELLLDKTAAAGVKLNLSRERVIRLTPSGPETALCANGSHILFLHPGDRLSPYALYYFARKVKSTSADLIYSDEDWDKQIPVFKPDWSPELLSSVNYLGRSCCYARDFLKGITSNDGWNLEVEISRGKPYVAHIPAVLYHNGVRCASLQAPALRVSRRKVQSTSRHSLSIAICSRRAELLIDCLSSLRATQSTNWEILVVHHCDTPGGDDIKAGAERFGARVIQWTGPFNFSAMNNRAAEHATGTNLLFVNDDILVRERGWDEAIINALCFDEVGIVGSLLRYPDGTIQHAGVAVGVGDGAGHCGRFQVDSELWPWLGFSREVSAVTGALLGIRTSVFRDLAGFDECFAVNYNDVDLCLRAREAGFSVLCLNCSGLIHKESQTRWGGTTYHEREELLKRWIHVIARGDPWYSRHLRATERISLGI